MNPSTDSPNAEQAFLKSVRPEFRNLLEERDGAARLLLELPKAFPPANLAENKANDSALSEWVRIGLHFLRSQRAHEALALFWALYGHLCEAQSSGNRVHKGDPLVWIYECYIAIGFHATAKRILMIILCEDAMGYKGNINANSSGLYFRAVWRHGMSDADLKRYAGCVYSLLQKHPTDCRYPEWALQELDRNWMDACPSAAEAFTYYANPRYVKHLLGELGDGTGKAMERLGDYLLSCMPGCRVARRELSQSTDYDLVCSMDGFELDFRSELGRYFVCECKDWSAPADFTTLAKFCRVLDSTKSRFGVLFSKQGISGSANGKQAANEQLKVFQDRGIVIVVVDESDLKAVSEGANFISMLRRKYEQVRLDLAGRNRPGA